MKPFPATYDVWRTSPPEEPEYHPGPHENPLCIENGDVVLDAIGVYDGEGELISVRINGADLPAHVVEAALKLLRCDYPAWQDKLDPDRLLELSNEASEPDGDALWERLRDGDE